jgi:hypothetical protein
MTAPPIPIEPLGSLPPAVIRHMDNAHGPTDTDRGGQADTSKQPQQREPRREAHGTNRNGQSLRGEPQYREPTPNYERQYSGQDSQRNYRQEPSRGPQENITGRDDRQDGTARNQQHTQRPSPGQNSGFVPVRQTPPMQTGTPHNAADAYLDRVQHDPRLQGLLEGAPSRSAPMASTAIGPALNQPSLTNPPQHYRRHSSLSHLDKPLPSPHQPQHRRYVSNGSQSQYAGSHMGGAQTSIRSGKYQGLHHRDKSRQDRGLAQPDRYPPFPTQPARSILDHAVPILSPDDQYRVPNGYIDPRHVPLPE